jgi:hypothetical protein
MVLPTSSKRGRTIEEIALTSSMAPPTSSKRGRTIEEIALTSSMGASGSRRSEVVR